MLMSMRKSTNFKLGSACAPDSLSSYAIDEGSWKTKKKGTIFGNPLSVLPRVINNSRGGEEEESGTATVPVSIFNLVNNVAGAGILTLSAGKATGTGWIPSIIICSLLGLASSHTFILIGKACELTGERDFKGLWSKTIGENTAYMVDSIIATMCLAVAFIYSGILGDIFTSFLQAAGLPDAFNFRTTNILVMTTVFLFPLSLIKDLSGLAFTSTLGFAAIIYTVLFVLFRSLDGTYSLGDGTDGAVSTMGRFLVDDVIMKPSFAKSSLWNLDFTSLILVSNLGLAYIAHYNGPIFYRELKDTNSKKFGNMVSIAFLTLTILNIAIMSAGYSTFGDTCQGNLLLNYHPSDILSTVGRLATGFSIMFGYPLVICGAREGIMGVASTLGYDISQHHVALVSSILALVTFVACTVDDVSLVVGLTGAALGSFIVYICPSIIYSNAVGIVKGMDSKEYNVAKRNLAFVPFGILIGSLGCYMTIKESLSQ